MELGVRVAQNLAFVGEVVGARIVLCLWNLCDCGTEYELAFFNLLRCLLNDNVDVPRVSFEEPTNLAPFDRSHV